MKRIFDHLRDRIYERAGLSVPKKVPSLDELRRDSWNPEFEYLMRNRLIMGSFRYETFEQKRKMGDAYDYPSYIKAKVAEYERTGNVECLVDVANCALLEYTFGRHPTKHFHATDDNSIHVQLKT